MLDIDQLAVVCSLVATIAVAVAGFALTIRQGAQSGARVDEYASRYFRFTITQSLVSGTAGLAVFVWLIDVLEIRPYHDHSAPIVWFYGFLSNGGLGVVLANIGARVLERTSVAGR